MAAFAGDQAGLPGIVYEAAANPQIWPLALASIASAFGSRGCLLTTPHFTPGGIPHSPGMKDVLDQFFSESWHMRDLRTNRARSKRCVQGFFSDHDILSSDEMARSDYYEGFARNAGVPWFAAAVLTPPDMEDDFVAISLQRSHGEGNFEKHELDALNALLPQLRNATELAKRLSAIRGESIAEGLGIAAEPAMLLDGRGRVVFVNAMARDILGTALNIVAGKVVAGRAGDNANLASLVDRACAALSSTGDMIQLSPVVIGAGHGEKMIVARAAPIRRSGADVLGFSGVLLMFTDLSAPRKVDLCLAQDMFGLTDREAQVLGRLGQDSSLEAVGRSLGISREAVRFHLKAIFLKTNTHRQIELVNLVSRLGFVSKI